MTQTPPLVDFQRKVDAWMQACFGPDIAADVTERNHRFLEEALELVQAKGCTASEAHQLVDYVFGRDVGEVNQEAGGVMVTLAALANAAGIDLHDAGETEVARVWTKIDKIREKQAAKPKHSPLPAVVESGARERLRKLTVSQFYQAAHAGTLAIDAVLADIRDVVGA